MNRRRLLIRLWLIGSAFWIAYVGWLISATSTFPDRNLLVTLVLTFGLPAAVFGLGVAVAWVMPRFRQGRRDE